MNTLPYTPVEQRRANETFGAEAREIVNEHGDLIRRIVREHASDYEGATKALQALNLLVFKA